MSAPHSQDGVESLRGRRAARSRRVPPPPRHPRADNATGASSPEPTLAPRTPAPPAPAAPPSTTTGGTLAQEVSIGRSDTDGVEAPVRERATRAALPVPSREIADEVPREVAREVPGRAQVAMPDLRIDINVTAALMPKPTVLSMPASVMARFSRVRRDASSHTAVVLDALRATVEDLPDLVDDARPQGRAGDLFPFRATAAKERRDPLRVRPTVAELAVIDRIVDWVADELGRRRPGSPRVSRSEVVAAALDAYLPGRRSRTIVGE